MEDQSEIMGWNCKLHSEERWEPKGKGRNQMVQEGLARIASLEEEENTSG